MKDHIEENNKLSNLYFYFIIISFIPILITGLISPNFNSTSLYLPLNSLLFVIQIFIIFRFYFSQTIFLINQFFLKFILIYFIMNIMGLLINLIFKNIFSPFDIINMVIKIIMLITLFSIPQKFYISQSAFISFMKKIVLFAVVACLFNIAINLKKFSSLLHIGNPYVLNLKSFFPGRNGFAQLLYIGTIANTFVFFKTKSKYYLALYILIFVNLIATLSRTSMLAIFIFIFALYLIYNGAKLSTKLIASSIGLIFIMILFIIIVNNSAIMNFVVNIIIRSNTGTSGRSELWKYGLNILDSTSWIFGAGHLNARNMLYESLTLNQFHNFYLETLIGEGIVSLILIVYIILVVSYRYRIILKNNQLIGSIYISAGISLSIYAFFESLSIFSMGYVSAIITVFFVTIPVLFSNNYHMN